MFITASEIQRALDRIADPKTAAGLMKFFKTGHGEYGEGDRFRGIKVPPLRVQAKAFAECPLDETGNLLQSPWHEDRLCALLILVEQYRRGNERTKQSIYKLYTSVTHRINNWDLVDLSAHHIVGAHLHSRSRAPLDRLAVSPLLWDRRIALIATFHFIRNNEFDDTLRLVRILLGDREDLMHKAMGWMLREVGKRDLAAEERFLREHLTALPRTTLRYAIERFPEEKRKAYLRGTI
jgi:3-methyladenine DNA glycosylase AlkD